METSPGGQSNLKNAAIGELEGEVSARKQDSGHHLTHRLGMLCVCALILVTAQARLAST